uniref:Uncharacterized protein n=1 Tax=Vitis vinifera TaxID=29760 RepID=F6GZ52_VITVI
MIEAIPPSTKPLRPISKAFKKKKKKI